MIMTEETLVNVVKEDLSAIIAEVDARISKQSTATEDGRFALQDLEDIRRAFDSLISGNTADCYNVDTMVRDKIFELIEEYLPTTVLYNGYHADRRR